MTLSRLAPLVALALAAVPKAALAEEEAPPPPQIFNDLVACRAIADDGERLACYDAQVAALQTAQQDESILVVDREEVRQAERTLFGIRIPDIRLFGGGEENGVDQIEATITAVGGGGRRPWSFRLDDGSLWVQIDSEILSRDPRPGQPIVIRRAALGSFRAEINGMRPIRVSREE